MENTVHNIILDMKIITLIEPHGRLYIHKDRLAIEKTILLQSIKRFILGDSRNTVLQRIKQRVSELEYLLSNKHIHELWLINELKLLIEPLKNGLTNLKLTYIEDSQTCVGIDMIIAQIINMHDKYLE